MRWGVISVQTAIIRQVMDDHPNTRGPKAARLQEKTKGKIAVKAGFRKGKKIAIGRKEVKKGGRQINRSRPLEEIPKETEGKNEEPPPRAFSVIYDWSSSLMLPKKDGDNEEAIKELKIEVEAQKMRCDGHERMIKDLQSICDTHENTLETLRQKVVELHRSNGTLSATYYGETYDIIT
jgi:hypothetical protein